VPELQEPVERGASLLVEGTLGLRDEHGCPDTRALAELLGANDAGGATDRRVILARELTGLPAGRQSQLTGLQGVRAIHPTNAEPLAPFGMARRRQPATRVGPSAICGPPL
jgi:hypothetical protein